MKDILNKTPVTEEVLASLSDHKIFSELSESNQKFLIEGLTGNCDKDGGFMGKLFGNKKENAAMNIALVICLLMAVIGVICMCLGKEQWNVIIPAIMTAVGYIFGRAGQ